MVERTSGGSGAQGKGSPALFRAWLKTQHRPSTRVRNMGQCRNQIKKSKCNQSSNPSIHPSNAIYKPTSPPPPLGSLVLSVPWFPPITLPLSAPLARSSARRRADPASPASRPPPRSLPGFRLPGLSVFSVGVPENRQVLSLKMPVSGFGFRWGSCPWAPVFFLRFCPLVVTLVSLVNNPKNKASETCPKEWQKQEAQCQGKTAQSRTWQSKNQSSERTCGFQLHLLPLQRNQGVQKHRHTRTSMS